MMPPATKQMQRIDAVFAQRFFNGLRDRLLKLKDSFRIEERFSRPIEIDVLEVEVDEQRSFIPKRTIDFKTLIE